MSHMPPHVVSDGAPLFLMGVLGVMQASVLPVNTGLLATVLNLVSGIVGQVRSRQH